VKSLTMLGLAARQGGDVQITALTADSREIVPGALFAALPGVQVHGATFVQTALDRGAAAILTDPEGASLVRNLVTARGAALVVAQDPRAALAKASALWFGPQPQTMVAVTGTNGKTSVTSFCRQIWELMGICGVNVGTTGVQGAWSHPLRHTTPDPITLHRILARAASEGVTHAAMEASSHGLDQRRLDGVVLRAAAFSNFSQDHLDYHGTFEAYFAAKMRLFLQVLGHDGIAVINLDDPKGYDVAAICAAREHQILGVGRARDALLQITGQRFDATGQDLLFTWQDRQYAARLNLIGGFQAENVLLAAGLVIAAGARPDDVFGVLGQLGTVRGRMEFAAARANGAAVFVDYAHTPDAVQTALRALRPHVMGRIVAIIGAGGDRDRTKRPLMGAAAARYADVVIVTDDNPRSEDPASIRAAVLAGASAGAQLIEIPDRAEAILRAVDMLQAGDALLIAGKGHESGQIIGDTVLPFDDVEQASLAVAALEGRI
jgi:UDP-N-acetylmuramoyl-L-alanyl-D-glutamate--2,6-diaminopimelate ligase